MTPIENIREATDQERAAFKGSEIGKRGSDDTLINQARQTAEIIKRDGAAAVVVSGGDPSYPTMNGRFTHLIEGALGTHVGLKTDRDNNGNTVYIYTRRQDVIDLKRKDRE